MTAIAVAVIGAGPAGLMAAEKLSAAGHAVTVFDRMPTPARRFLMAGVGGLNLTHDEDFAAFTARYREAEGPLHPALDAFGPRAMREWADGLGAETFTGSSGRVFPRAMKASPLLRAWLARLEGQGVRFALRHDWRGWEGEALAFDTPDGPVRVTPGATILATGGASWPRLGSNGAWTGPVADAGVPVAPLRPSNCGIDIAWSARLVERFAGVPLKTIALRVGAETVRGEAIVTRRGLEGGAVYALSPLIREAVAVDGAAAVSLDLKPGLSVAALTARLTRARKGDSLSNTLRKAARLDPVAIAILREADTPREAEALAARIKAMPLTATGVAGLERAISTAGGVRFDGLDPQFMLQARPGTFAAGEMLDWEAPTGGYLLQASFATGAAAARGVTGWLASTVSPTASST